MKWRIVGGASLTDGGASVLHAAQSLDGAFLLTVVLVDYLAPIKIVEKPPHRVLQALFKRVEGCHSSSFWISVGSID